MEGNAFPTDKLTVASTVCPRLEVSEMVYVLLGVGALGVPLISQVELFTIKPAGRGVVPSLIMQLFTVAPLPTEKLVGRMFIEIPAFPDVPVAPA